MTLSSLCEFCGLWLPCLAVWKVRVSVRQASRVRRVAGACGRENDSSS